MNKIEKNEIIEVLKTKFAEYANFYITDTESLTVEEISNIRKECYHKKVEMRVAKNTLIKKSLEQIDAKKYEGIFPALNHVTALFFSNNPKDPALIISNFRSKSKEGKKPSLKLAYVGGEVYKGDDQLEVLTKLKTKQELIGEVVGLLQSPAKRVIAGLLHHHESKKVETPTI